MCGVYGIFPGLLFGLEERFGLTNAPKSFEDVYSLKFTPGSRVPTVSRNSPNTLVWRRWGLAPKWVEDPYKMKFATFNARAETVAKAASFRNAWQKRQRCLLPASYFVEWETVGEGKEKRKLPWRIGVKREEIFGLAGLYEVWTDAEGKEVETCTVITTKANRLVGKLHQRQPVIIGRKDEETWLDRETELEEVAGLMRPLTEGEMGMGRIDETFNKARAEEVKELMMHEQ